MDCFYILTVTPRMHACRWSPVQMGGAAEALDLPFPEQCFLSFPS